ncbi:recombinase family protein [Kribbella sandramycini]|uniref:DNA invertase Pin-like site-specific DNA recombinase n=1 Tax=Kribbella sandramycini TaxID=60450 RepID=A0A841SL96_9ACTN|nr:recombinase family protein [Kribbella sandramycini]MBB6570804.1 DNA invertase Pin-like site-specific DNA recombinase [Kribbella sandramycini]
MPIRRLWADKMELLLGGAAVTALAYHRSSNSKDGRKASRKSGKKVTGKSVKDQALFNHRAIEARGWKQVLRDFVDDDVSASSYSDKERPDYQALLEAIEEGFGDVIVFYELSRQQRDLAVYVQIRDLCMKEGLYFWYVAEELYDLRVRADRLSLNNMAVQGEDFSHKLSADVKRGMYGAALEGKPHGKIRFGYRRLYDPDTGEFLDEVADDVTQNPVDADGNKLEPYTRAAIAHEVFTSLDQGIALNALEENFRRREIVSRNGNYLTRTTLREMALNQAYIGKRSFKGQIIADGVWGGLIEEEVFWSVNARLTDPKRKTTRPGSGKYFASYIGRCDCVRYISVELPREKMGWKVPVYRCPKCGWWIPVDELDSFIESVLIAWLSRDDVFELLDAVYTADSEDIAEARAEVKRLEAEKEKWLRDAAQEEVSAATVARFELDFNQKVKAAEARANVSTMPEPLNRLAGPNAAERWAAIEHMTVKREVLRELGGFTIRAEKYKDNVPLEERIEWGGLLSGNPDAHTHD